MTQSKSKVLKLNDVYTPSEKGIVIEATIENVTKGGIHIPDGLAEKKRVCVVVAVGEEVTRCKVGDRVMIDMHTSPPVIDLVSHDHVQISEHNVLGVVSKNYVVPEHMKSGRIEGAAAEIEKEGQNLSIH